MFCYLLFYSNDPRHFFFLLSISHFAAKGGDQTIDSAVSEDEAGVQM